MAARQTRHQIGAPVAFLALAGLLAGCKSPSINLATSEPIKVDIAMRLDVYQHAPDNGAAKPTSTPSPTPTARAGTAAERQKNRAADIQVFKNSRLVGEAHTGLLVVLTEPAGDYGDYVRTTIATENADRMTRMKAMAKEQKKPLPEIQTEQAALWVNRSFTGEWIETLKPGTTTYQWAQKQG